MLAEASSIIATEVDQGLIYGVDSTRSNSKT
jgi:hypothetical protein